MEGRQERVEPLDRAYDLSSLSSEVEAVARGDRSMQQCPTNPCWTVRACSRLSGEEITRCTPWWWRLPIIRR